VYIEQPGLKAPRLTIFAHPAVLVHLTSVGVVIKADVWQMEVPGVGSFAFGRVQRPVEQQVQGFDVDVG
jgi:hypothetical protein